MRSRNWGWIAILAVFLMVVVVFIAVLQSESRDRRVAAEGQHVDAIVTGYEKALRGRKYVTLRYEFVGVSYTGQYVCRNCPGIGHTVAIIVDPSAPSRFVTEGGATSSTWTRWGWAVVIVGGLTTIGFAIRMALPTLLEWSRS